MKFVSAIFSMLAVVAYAVSCIAQTSDEIQSDRPGMSFSSSTVGARMVQLQFGGQYDQITSTTWKDGYSGGLAEGQIRVGVLERFEIGFWGAYQRHTRTDQWDRIQETEAFNFSIQARGNVLKADGYIPSIGLFLEVIFPDKETPRVSENIVPRMLLLIDQKLHKRVSLASNIGMAYMDVPLFLYTLNLSVNVTSRMKLFAEHMGQYASRYDNASLFNPYLEDERMDDWFARINGGCAVLVTNDLQLDLQAGHGLNAVPNTGAKDWYVGAGISWRVRIPKRKKTEATAPSTQ